MPARLTPGSYDVFINVTTTDGHGVVRMVGQPTEMGYANQQRPVVVSRLSSKRLLLN